MVNKEILNYLKQNKENFSLDSLKRRIIGAGYSEQEFEEAIKELQFEETRTLPPPPSEISDSLLELTMPSKGSSNKNSQTLLTQDPLLGIPKPSEAFSKPVSLFSKDSKNNGITPQFLQKTELINPKNAKFNDLKNKWMKTAGFIGLVLFLLNLVFIIVYFLMSQISEIQELIFSASMFIPFLIMGFIVVIFVLLFFYGFIQMGKYVESKLISFSSGILMILFLIQIGLIIVFLIFGFSTIQDSVSNLDNSFINSNINLFFILPFSGFILVMEILLIAFTLFNSIGFILFFISLINFRKRMNFVGMAGIIGLISVFGLTILFIFFLFFTSVFLRVNILFIILAAIFYIGGLITLLLLSYALKHASMKFEI